MSPPVPKMVSFAGVMLVVMVASIGLLCYFIFIVGTIEVAATQVEKVAALEACSFNQSLPFWGSVVQPRSTTLLKGIQKLYVIHYSPLVARRIQVEKDLTYFFGEQWRDGNFVSFVTQFDKQNITNTMLRELVGEGASLNDPHIKDFSSLATVSIAAKHWAAYFDALYHGYEQVVVIEDDVVFNKSLDFGLILDALPDNWSNCYLGTWWDFIDCQPVENQSVVCRQKQGTGSNGMVAYLISRDGACRMMNHLPITTDPDHHVNALSWQDEHFITYRTTEQYARETKLDESTWKKRRRLLSTWKKRRRFL